MLQIQSISKQYTTGELTQSALDHVSFNLRDSELVAVLGPSGSGKTTLLNIIGGLDRYDSGDLIINGISTKKYTDRDWDSYRNHTIGFVFQSYNLIPHQSVLANVELALTISGISKSERRKRAKEALTQVGLGDQVHKRPNQMSGGQMQRVAIARALVNDPDILLADEPTGALDSETSLQVMDLLKEVAKDRLVVLVTHNQELAHEYANRIIRLQDGKIIDDSNPCELDETQQTPPKHKNMGKASMSFFTALALSFNNLRTKKGRTFLTAFAGSIGIIGIAMILSLSTGVNQYIEDIQKDTMSSYPITIQAQTMDLSSLLSMSPETSPGERRHELDAVYADARSLEMANSFTSSLKTNNLTRFKQYLDDPSSEIHQYIGENGIVYSYDVKFDAYAYDPEGTIVNTDGSTINDAFGMGGMASSMSVWSDMMTTSNFSQLLPGTEGQLISNAVTDNYDMLYGTWPQAYDELVLILNENNEIDSTILYDLGLLPMSQYIDLMGKLMQGQEIEVAEHKWSYEDICKQVFYLVPASNYYVKNSEGLYDNIKSDKTQFDSLVQSSVQLKITGIIRVKEDATYSSVSGTVGYTKDLTDYLIDTANNSEVVKAQEANPGVNVVNGMSFAPDNDQEKIADAKEYLAALSLSDKAKLGKEMMSAVYSQDPDMLQQIQAMGEAELAAMLDQMMASADDDTFLSIYKAYVSPGSYDDNMTTFGLISVDAPSAISIYADNFENKDAISQSITNYNKTVGEEDQIVYTDLVGLLMSSITTIINVISYVLIAFVSVSLIVSSIMIGIITFISVLERTKEIGILRAIGASKRNISQVFNAETFIVGLISGLLGIGITLLLLIPSNAVIHALTDTTTVNAILPIDGAAFLVVLSMILTLIAGLIPSRKAAKKDPVIALRTE